MILIGVVFLVLAAAGVAAAVVTGRDVRVHLDAYDVSTNTTVLWVFCAGALTMLLLVLALSAFRRAARRRRARRRELKTLRAEEAATAQSRAEHRAEPVDVRDDRGVAEPVDVPDRRSYVPDDERV